VLNIKGLVWWPGTESNRRRQPFQGCAHRVPGRAYALSIHLFGRQLALADIKVFKLSEDAHQYCEFMGWKLLDPLKLFVGNVP
jgi:hypothetical protein